MNRKKFIKTASATLTLTIFNPLQIVEELVPEQEVYLPFIDGMRKVTRLKSENSLVNNATAQYYYGGYSYGSLAPYQNWYAYQQALHQWQQQMLYWRQQQYYAWLRRSHIQRMQQLLYQYRNYQQIGQPQVWSNVKSIYGFARDNYAQPTLFGLNKYRNNVSVKDNIKGAAKIFDAINNYYGASEAQKTVGPQSSESNAAIKFGNKYLYGKKYDTENGIVAISNPDQKVTADNGKVGQLAKYVTGPDGEQYAVV